MGGPFPSIQSFFHPDETSPRNARVTSSPSANGDGFTAEEVQATAPPASLHIWQTRGTYEEADIATLIPGPGGVALVGRVVNYHHLETPSKAPHAAKGCIRMVVKDDSAAIVVGYCIPHRSCSSVVILPFSYNVVGWLDGRRILVV